MEHRPAIPARPCIAVSIEREARTDVVAVSGELDLETAPALRRALDRVLVSDRPHVVIDVAGLSFCDSSGLSELVLAHRRASAAGGRVELRGAHGPVARVLEVTNLDKVLHLVPGRVLPEERSS